MRIICAECGFFFSLRRFNLSCPHCGNGIDGFKFNFAKIEAATRDARQYRAAQLHATIGIDNNHSSGQSAMEMGEATQSNTGK